MARTQIKTPGIANDAVTAAQIAAGAVGTAEIATGAVTADKIADGAVGTAEIADNAVTDIKLATITTAGKISDTALPDSISSNITGNAASVTNGVYTTGEQIIPGLKRFYNSNGIIIGNDTTPVLPGGASRSKWLIRNTGGERGDLEFYVGNATVPEWTQRVDFIDTGVIQANGFEPRSDYRLKENITPVNEISNLIKNISTYKFNFKSDPDNTIKYGFIAHELQEIFPNLVTGQKDGYKNVGTLREYDGTLVSENIEKPESLIWEELITTNDGQQEKVTRTRTWEKTEEKPVYQSISSDGLIAVAMQGLKESLNKIEILENSLNEKQKQLEECLDRIAKLENKSN
jgi:hypothetical protein